MQVPPITRPPVRLGARDQLAQQPRLADPRFAGDEVDRRQLLADVPEQRPLELGELGLTADETAGGDALGHPSVWPHGAESE